MRKNIKLIIIISIIVAVVIAGTIFAYIFIKTDVLKSSGELFWEYFTQNVEIYQKVMEFKTNEVVQNLRNESKYQSNTSIKVTHSEGGEISNLINDFSAQVDIQRNNDEQYLYADAQMIYKDEECVEAEVIEEQGKYGVKFPGISKKFVTIQNDEKLQLIANDMGIDIGYLEMIMDFIDGNLQIISEEQIARLKDKYINIIQIAFSEGVFEKQKNALITYNDVTTETNAYSVYLSSEQVGSLLIELLNNVKFETEVLEDIKLIIDREKIVSSIDEKINNISDSLEIPEIKITVYEHKQQTIRTVLEVGTQKLILENVEVNGEIKSNISYVDDEMRQYEVELSKVNTNNHEKIEMTTEVIDGTENYAIIFYNEMNKSDNQININTEITHKQDITTKSIALENKIITGEEFEKKKNLTADENVMLNTLDEVTRQQFIAELKERLPKKIDDKVEAEIGQTPEEDEEQEQITQADINKFNAKFEFYTGEEVSEENVRKLLDIVKNNIIGHVITTVEDANTTSSVAKQKKMMTIYIEKDKTNEESMTKILENVEKNKKYKISISYKDTDGLIDYISITEN